jgi:hypothetical protein
MPEPFDAKDIAEDLNDCRQRGLDRLDVNNSTQKPVRAAELGRLAADYAKAESRGATERVGQIKALLGEGIDACMRQGNVGDGQLLRDLFFGGPADIPIGSPGDRLETARRKFHESESRFRDRRSSVMTSFAGYLILFVHPITGGHNATGNQLRQTATIGKVGDSQYFIQRLAEAAHVTIVGITNENLTQILEKALRRKREANGPEACWTSMRIVFLGKALLSALNDEREKLERQDTGQALSLRLHQAVSARRSVWDLLKRAHSTRWEMYESPYMPELNGTLLEFDDGTKFVHQVIRRPGEASSEHIHVELQDFDGSFKSIFDDIIKASANADMIVPAGYPDDDGEFTCTEARDQRKVLSDEGTVGRDWLPMVLVITSTRDGGQTEAMLQLRTPDNSARELGRLSHLAGHILQDDRLRPLGRILDSPPKSFGLSAETPRSAAYRVVQEISAVDLASGIRPEETGRYLYPDKEHLFFFVFVLDLPEGLRFDNRHEMQPYPFSELLAIRASRVLASAGRLCRMTDISASAFRAAAEVLGHNLVLHDHPDLAAKILELADRGPEKADELAAEFEEHVTPKIYPSLAKGGKEIEVLGLAGWQHREFFNALLRIYTKIRISGARELAEDIERDERKRDAVEALSRRYGSLRSIASMPFNFEEPDEPNS